MLAVRSGALGDTILTLPALDALRRAVGLRGRVDFLGRLPQAQLLLGPCYASAVHDIERSPFHALFSETADPAVSSFLEPFDIVVSWATLPGLSECYSGRLLSGSPMPADGIHAAEHLLRVLDGSDLRTEAPSFPLLKPRSEADALREQFLEEAGLEEPFVAIHPSSGSRDKNWHPDRFHALALRAISSGLRLLWIEGEADAYVVRPLERLVPAPIASGLALPVLGAILSRASLYIGNDSGVTHLAAAFGAPTVAVFGSTDARSWRPLGDRVLVANSAISSDELWGIAYDRFVAH